MNDRRSAIEQKLAERDRERTAVWGDLTAIRAAHERLGARTEAIAAREAELRAAIASRQKALGALATELRASHDDAEAALARELEAAAEGLDEASAGLGEARASEDLESRLAGLGRLRGGSERAARSARRAEDMLGHRRQDSLQGRIESEVELAEELASLCAALGRARDAVGGRAAALEEKVIGRRTGDDLAVELRECSRAEADLQARLRQVGERVTAAEVRAAQLGERREEAIADRGRIVERLGIETPEPERLPEERRAEIEARIERLVRRREQLGPVNPLAEREYDEAKSHVSELESQREDLERALSELEKLIRQTDREISAAFEETFAAASRNFEELIEHMFPGGRGRLRMVEPPKPSRVLGGGEEAAQEPADGEAADAAEVAEGEGEETGGDDRGVEIEVTPAGKATRRLSLLSGGEKSLVALAFVFSVFLARPSPFYILDEVEAALDDANIDRFLQLVRRFSDRAQFVIVTHQKRTMDAADVLYGVSMQDGATKVISRRLPREPQLDDGDVESPAEDGPARAAA
jgi:chromosome segregation protein